MSNAEVERSIEAILMVVDEPVTEVVLAQVLERPVEEIEVALSILEGSYEERGFALRKINGGWRFYSHPNYSAVVEKFVLDGQQSRLTQAALETLSVIAYRQPVSRARVSAIRGSHQDHQDPAGTEPVLEDPQWSSIQGALRSNWLSCTRSHPFHVQDLTPRPNHG